MDAYSHIVAFVLDHPWAITPPMLRTVADILARRIAGSTLTAAELEAAYQKREKIPQPAPGAVAVIPIHGVILPRGNMFSEMSGATSLDKLSASLREAVSSPAVETIVLDIDSPGGSVAGTMEFARDVLAARAKKPVVAVAQYLAASAAYWIGSQATEFVASPSAGVGSIGVYAIHDDLSKALEEFGIKRTYISAGKFKVDGNETEPLSDTARAHMQGIINTVYDRFVADIARGRAVPKDTVKKSYGEGRVLMAEDALAAGMIDKIATLDETLGRFAKPTSTAAATLAAGAPTPDTAQDRTPDTAQDRTADRAWRNSLDRALLELSL